MPASSDQPKGGGGTAGAVRAWVAWWVLLTALYVVLVDTRRLQELVAAVLVGALGACAAVLVRRERDLVLRPRPRVIAAELRAGLRWPRDLALLALALVRRPRGRIVEVAFKADVDDPEGAAHNALAVAGRSLAPNRVVIEIDDEKGVLRYHELVDDDR